MGVDLSGDVRGLTIRQPCASLICPGVGREPVKTIETRPGSWKWTGTVLIHAGAEWAPGWCGRWFSWSDLDGPVGWTLSAIGAEELAEDVNTGEWFQLDRHARRRVPLGAVLGVADITAVLSISNCSWTTEHVCSFGDTLLHHSIHDTPFADGETEHDISDQLPFGDFTPGRKALLLDNIRSLPRPVPARGALGLWRPAPDVLTAVQEQPA